MRKFILIAAMVLVSASAQAGPSRSLTLASNDEAAKVEQPKALQDKAAQDKAVDELGVETPKYVERPAAVGNMAEPAKADQVKPAADKTAEAPKVEKKRRHESTEARVIYELHRHGIYW
jgi:hypothetical protein